MPEPDYSFVLQPDRETTFNAGEYDRETQRPTYALTISAPDHVKHQIETEQFLIRTGDGHLWAWRIKNKSSWPAFIIITVDGKLLQHRE